ncbi:MAG: hypothetical protein QOF76_3265 [Solirubrobacteraceae bacterium]|nr:hypothetical protein [Solirubrobacteraceae bacterium]
MPTEADRTARLAAWVFGALLVATFAAFFLASVLKSQPGVMRNFSRMKFFSPNGDGIRDFEQIHFRIDKTDRLDVDVVDSDGARVRRLQSGKHVRKRQTVHVRWNGRTDAGKRAPDGNYSLRVSLTREGRSVLAPRSFFLDTTLPKPSLTVDPADRVVAPGTAVAFAVAGADPAAAPKFSVVRTDVSPPQAIRAFDGTAGQNSGSWDGKDDSGIVAPAGTYVIRVRSSDIAGNVAEVPALPLKRGAIPGRPGVTVRALGVQPPVEPVRAGGLAGFNVDARGLAFSWRLRRVGSGKVLDSGIKAAGKTSLLVQMPKADSGLYLLEVQSHGADVQVPVAVQGAESKPLLVVLPTIAWLGEDPLDSDGDGLPDTLVDGATISFPRLYAYPGGLPTGLADSVGGLLGWLDEQKVHYDLTTDLALGGGDEPTADRAGVLFAGAPEWVSPQIAARLRTYVKNGGKLALFAPRALRAAVNVSERALSNPTQLTDTDALGAKLGPVHPASAPVLRVQHEDASIGLLEGFAGDLKGFSAVEELQAPGQGQTVATSVGVADTALRPALSAVRDGKGLVIRVGLPEWVGKLRDGDSVVSQLTFNIVDILRGATPQVRSAN